MKRLNEKQVFWAWLTIGILSLASFIKEIIIADSITDWLYIIFQGIIVIISTLTVIYNWKHK